MLMLIAAVLVICIAMSTRADRTAARRRLRPIGWALTPIAALLWAWIIWAVARGPPA